MISNELKQKLNKFIRKYYLNKLTKGSMYAVGLSMVYILLVSVLEYYGRFNSNTRLFMLIALLAGVGFIGFRYLLVPLFGLFKLGKHLSYAEAAKIVGKHFNDVDDRVLNTIELGLMSNEQSALVQASIEQKLISFRSVPFNKAISLKENLKYWPILVIPTLIFGVLAVTGQFGLVSEGSKRIVEYNKNFKPVAPFSFILLNKELTAEEGSNFVVQLGFDGESLPESAQFVSENGKGRFVKVGLDKFEYTIDNVKDDLSFRIEANGFSSADFELDVVAVPRVRSLVMRVDPPKYTGLKPFIAPSKSIIDIPEGSEVFWDVNTKSTNKAALVSLDSSFSMVGESNGSFSLNLKVRNSFKYKLITANDNVKKEGGETNEINVIKDGFPEIDVILEVDSMRTNVLFYRGQVSDDYGFTRLRVVGESKGKEVVLKKLSVASNGQNGFAFSGALELDSLADKYKNMKVYVKIWDNDGVNGAKFSLSTSLQLKLLNKEERKEELAKQNEEYFSGKQELNKRNEEIRKELERLKSKMLNKNKADWKDKEKVREALQEQKDLLDKQKELNKEKERLDKLEEKEDGVKEELQEKKDKIEELKKDPKQEELDKLLEEIAKLMDKLDLEELAEKLEEMEKLSEQNQRKEERIDKLLEDLKFQKDVLEESEKLKELAEKMEELSKEDGDKEEELEKQEEIKEEFEKSKEKIEELKKENEEFEKMTEEQKMDENEEKADESMEQSEQELQKDEKKKANEEQKKSSEEMSEMSDKMSQSLMQMQSDQHQEDMKTLRQILENLETLSFDVEELGALSKESSTDDPLFRKLLTDQKKLMDGAVIIEDSLVALGERIPEIKEIVYDELEAIESNLDRSIQALEERKGPQSAAYQQYVMTAANNLALMLDQALQSMQEQMANMMKGEQSCQKPGSGKPSMSNMKKMQNELGKKMQQMKDGQKKGQGKKKGSEGDPKELVEMLSKQEQLRRQLEEFMENEGKSGDKGNLAKAIEEMKELEKDLLKGKINPEALERVKEIETRLLESEKATLEQKEDEKRESKTAEDRDQLYKDELEKYLNEKEKELDNLYHVPLNMNNYYKSQSNQYINKL